MAYSPLSEVFVTHKKQKPKIFINDLGLLYEKSFAYFNTKKLERQADWRQFQAFRGVATPQVT